MKFLVSTSKGNPVTDYIPEAEECIVSGCYNLQYVRYVIEVADLTSLLSLIKDYPIIIDKADYNDHFFDFEIEIYNGYRE